MMVAHVIPIETNCATIFKMHNAQQYSFDLKFEHLFLRAYTHNTLNPIGKYIWAMCILQMNLTGNKMIS